MLSKLKSRLSKLSLLPLPILINRPGSGAVFGIMRNMITIGLDEVGRGCWAGPLVAAAVALNDTKPSIVGLNDSKKLSGLQRQTLDTVIRARAIAIGIGWVSPEAIDTIGITAAVRAAMQQALEQVIVQLHEVANGSVDDIIIDGNYNFLSEYAAARTMVGADGLVSSVSAASIIAKVSRDTYMAEQAAREYPQYGFEKHVGYGTARHIAMLKQHGVTPLHRMSYKPIKQILLQSKI
jgi:ribonuclease HII